MRADNKIKSISHLILNPSHATFVQVGGAHPGPTAAVGWGGVGPLVLTSSGWAAWLCRAFWRSSTCCCSSTILSRLSLDTPPPPQPGNERAREGDGNTEITMSVFLNGIQLTHSVHVIGKRSSALYTALLSKAL